MAGRHVVLLISGWVAFFYLALCSSPVSKDVLEPADRVNIGEALAKDGQVFWPEAPMGALSVVDAAGRLVGILVARTHPQRGDSDLYDAVQVYNPEYRLFFGIHMSSGKVLLPAKIMFGQGSCSGKVGVRATCPECLSGYDLGFSWGNTWYRMEGGVERESFTYSAYVPPESDGKCTGHGMSSTYAYPAQAVDPLESPPAFSGPLQFVWQ